MYSFIALFYPEGDSSVAERLAGLGGAVAPVLEGSFNGGDMAAHFTFGTEAEFRTTQRAIEGVLAGIRADTVLFGHGEQGVGLPELATGVHRTLLLCADHAATPERLDRFAFEMVRMPHYIPAIRNWRLSRVIEASGQLAWTHVWEQEYENVGGLLGPYMLHPYHWGSIDRWFDPECPDWLVHPNLCHSYSAYGRSIIV